VIIIPRLPKNTVYPKYAPASKKVMNGFKTNNGNEKIIVSQAKRLRK